MANEAGACQVAVMYFAGLGYLCTHNALAFAGNSCSWQSRGTTAAGPVKRDKEVKHIARKSVCPRDINVCQTSK
eukprot:scaffold153487_cov52-Prasinocladus_malaysianus.AAC.1